MKKKTRRPVKKSAKPKKGTASRAVKAKIQPIVDAAIKEIVWDYVRAAVKQYAEVRARDVVAGINVPELAKECMYNRISSEFSTLDFDGKTPREFLRLQTIKAMEQRLNAALK